MPFTLPSVVGASSAERLRAYILMTLGAVVAVALVLITITPLGSHVPPFVRWYALVVTAPVTVPWVG